MAGRAGDYRMAWWQRRCKSPRGQRVRRLRRGKSLLRRGSSFTVEPPLLHQHRLKLVLHEARPVAQLGGKQALPHVTSQHGERRQLEGEFLRFAHVVVLGGCCEVAETDGGEEGQAGPGAVRLASNADGWHAHQQGFACCCGVRVWEGIEGNVDLVVNVEVVEGSGCQGHELQPVLCNAVGLELAEECLLSLCRVEALVFHEQPTARNLAENTRPERHAWVAHLGQVAEAAKSHKALAQGRKCLHVGDARRRRVAQKAPWYSDQFLAKCLLGVRRIHHVVHNSIVDGA
mmetsp:Transcript_35185/g.56572  ORF Transcript_35185/g.56572 Transcript_35185/m.56572 type:complete len:288 (+) Transcript_35185:381-1244(+)